MPNQTVQSITNPHAANDNTPMPRPAEFDLQLAAAYPRLLARAARFTNDPGALAGQTVLTALNRWASFRQTPGNPYYGFFTWLCWCMKGSASDVRQMRARRIVMVSADAVDNPPEIAVNGAQEASADLAAVLSVLSPRERDVLLRRAGGEMLIHIAADWGVTKQRVSQIEFEARAKVLAVAGANDDDVQEAA